MRDDTAGASTARAAHTSRTVDIDRSGDAGREDKRVVSPAAVASLTSDGRAASMATDGPRPTAADARRNPGMPLDLDWVQGVRVNRSAVERRAATLGKRRTVKKEWQAAWLVRAVECMDLTALSGDDTPGRIRRLCAKARRPVRGDIVEALGLVAGGAADARPVGNAAGSAQTVAESDGRRTNAVHVGAVCVYHEMVETAVEALRGHPIPIAAVSTGFPAGLNPFEQRLAEIRASVAAGAREIDVVISRRHVLTGHWTALYDEVRAFRDACGDAHMKTIVATGELGTLRNVGRASLVCMMAGADFVKTSTGKEPVNATLPVGLVMVRAVREYCDRTGYKVGFKPAGGIRTAKQALEWLILMKEELGDAWLSPALFRLGASSLLGDIERQLEHYVTGRYSADFRHPVA